MSEQLLHPEPLAPEPSSESPQTPSSITERPKRDRISFEDAQRFLHALAPTGAITFQTLAERKRKGTDTKSGPTKLIHERELRKLAKYNGAGAGVFVMVNIGNGEGRSADDVLDVRAIFVDLDGAELEPVLDAPIPPSITVESSPGRYHAYWLVQNMPKRDFKPAQQRLAAMFNGDTSVCDLPRLMRVPGFLHHKSESPFRSRLLRCEPELVWDWYDLAKGLGLPTSTHLPTQIPEGRRNSTLFGLACAAARTGTSKSECLVDLARINEERCVPPLPATEVDKAVESAYKMPLSGELKIPLSLFRDERFVSLGMGPKLLLLLSYQRVVNKPRDADIALLWKDFKQHFPRQATFTTYRATLAKLGLFVQRKKVRRYIEGGKPDYNLYRLGIT